MKQYSKLREVLIKTITQLVDTELTGYMVYDGSKCTLVNPDYSEEKKIILKMIDDCNVMSGFEKEADENLCL